MQIIRASEVGEYVYCARAWWLRRVVGEEPAGRERRAEGVAMHMRHGHGVRQSWMALWAGLLLLVVGLLLALF